MQDPFGRRITYLRLSLTDRCDLRCTYCLPGLARFTPRAQQLSIDELERLAGAFIRLGVTKLRLTGGEPLVRRGAVELVERLGRHVRSGALNELTMTTNGTQLARHARTLAAAGMERINVSLDHLDPAQFARITRGGRLAHVLEGIDAALAAGIKVKINTVVLRHDNLHHIPELVAWAHGKGMGITLIEVMPMGDIGADRLEQHVALPEARKLIEQRWTLTDIALSTGGPARYARTEAGGLIGFITPLSNIFCEGCNRVRVDATGRLHACLGRDVSADLSGPLRATPDDRLLERAIRDLIAIKPKSHQFEIVRGSRGAVPRPMAATGG